MRQQSWPRGLPDDHGEGADTRAHDRDRDLDGERLNRQCRAQHHRASALRHPDERRRRYHQSTNPLAAIGRRDISRLDSGESRGGGRPILRLRDWHQGQDPLRRGRLHQGSPLACGRVRQELRILLELVPADLVQAGDLVLGRPPGEASPRREGALEAARLTAASALPAGNWTLYPHYFGKKSSYPPVGHRGAADHSCAITGSWRSAPGRADRRGSKRARARCRGGWPPTAPPSPTLTRLPGRWARQEVFEAAAREAGTGERPTSV